MILRKQVSDPDFDSAHQKSLQHRQDLLLEIFTRIHSDY